MAKTIKKTPIVKKAIKKPTPKVVYEIHAEVMGACGAVFSGIKIARLRIYNDGRVFAYKAPGHNIDYIGHTTDSNMINALFMARNSGNSVTGYTDNLCKIVWLDY